MADASIDIEEFIEREGLTLLKTTDGEIYIKMEMIYILRIVNILRICS